MGRRHNPLNYNKWLEEVIDRYDGDFEAYYPQSAGGVYRPEREESLYRGHNVIWDGIEGHMIRVPAQNVAWNLGNILEPEKLSAVVRGIRDGEDVIFYAAWGEIQKVDLQTIKESIEYADDDEYGVLTTGNEELDEFLVDPGEVLTNYTDEPEAFCEKYNELLAELKEAEEKKTGDIGEWIFTPTDGHHRVWGAILAGEPYVWVMLSGNQLQNARRGRTEKDRELAEMLE